MHIIAPHMSCALDLSDQPVDGVTPLERAIADGYTQIYVPTAEGYFKFHVFPPGAGGRRRFVCLPAKEVPGVTLSKMEPAVQFLPDGKIPMELFETIKHFFTQVMVRKGQKLEAMIWILWNETDGYFLHVPDQTVGPASANYDWTSLPSGSRLIVDIHSHADFGAFFSGTDDNDDRNSVRFSGVVGYNNRPVREMKFRFNYFGTKIDIGLESIFEHRVSVTPAPDDWFEKIKTHSYSGYQHSVGQRYGNFANRGVAGMDSTPNVYPHSGYQGGHGLSGPYQGIKHTGGSRLLEEDAGDDELDPVGASASVGGTGPKKLSKAERRALKRQGQPPMSDPPPSRGQRTQTSGSSRGNEGGSVSDGQFSRDKLVQIGDGSLVTGVDVDSDEFANMYPHSQDFVNDLRAAVRNSGTSGVQTFSPTQQEMDLQEQAEEHLGSIVSGASDQNLSILHADFDSIAVNHGLEVARAFAAVDLLSGDLVQAPSLLHRAVQEMFQLVDKEDKLKLFRRMADEALSEEDKSSLASNGL